MHRVERFIYKNHFQPTPGTHNTTHKQILTQTNVWYYLHIAKRTYVHTKPYYIYTIIDSYNIRTNVLYMYMLSNLIIYI